MIEVEYRFRDRGPSLEEVQYAFLRLAESARAKLYGQSVDEDQRTQDRDTVDRWQRAEGVDLEGEAERVRQTLRVEARAAIQQAEELRRVLEKLEVLADGKTELPALLAHLRKQDPLLVSAEHHHRKAVSS